MLIHRPPVLWEQNNSWRWLVKLGGWVAKLVAHLLATAALWVRIYRHLQRRTKMGDISKGVANTLHPIKKLYKKLLLNDVATG
jgi:hypothetical protein